MYQIIVSIILLISLNLAQAKLPADCECPAVACANPCEMQDGVTFYSEKCGGGQRVKSCAKPTCIPKTDIDEACLAFKKSQGDRAVASSSTSDQPSSSVFVAHPQIGEINFLSGQAWIKSEMGDRKIASMGMEVHETDTVITNPDGKVQIKLKDGNLVNVLSNSQTKLTKMEYEGSEKSTVIDLIKGKVRSKVIKKYNGADYFKVRTQSAVAGVRGTEFVVSYEINDKAVTKVQTIEGSVDLKSGDEKQTQNLLAGQEGSFVVAANTEVFNEDEINDFISRGYMTPVYKMTANELNKLNAETEINIDQKFERSIAKARDAKGNSICSSPKGSLNQCAWECVNNGSGEKKCRTDLENVHCVRKRCNANGEWADEMRLPASYYGSCKPYGVEVKDCDY